MRAVLLIALVACKDKPKPPPTPPPERPEPARGLGDQLRYEAEHRPGGPLAVEAVLAKLATAGAAVDPIKQYLGKTARARYCAGGHTREGLGIAVCEYESEEAARTGRDHVTTAFPNVPGRKIELRGALSLTTTATDAEDEALRAKVEESFRAM
ncbi:MAG: hypothetical protein M4D80_05110 [Myxococcota bacterium]|nr:hypothetical protein [Deltaproteobacteria bacterium]MDQ3334517.1 hypothetical protein [Myxococcota bacterium]